MRRLGALAIILTMGAPLAAWAQDHSADDEAACTPDVMRLCQEHVPNRDDIVACLTEKKKQLNADCFKVFSRPPSQRAADEDRRRRRKPVTHAPN